MLNRIDNSYLDESWSNGSSKYHVGTTPLQKRICGLLNTLSYNVRDVCVSNLIFNTTPSSEDLCFGLAGLCWPFHEQIIEIIKPKLILTFGNSKESPYAFIKALFFRKNQDNEQVIPSGHGDWTCKGFHALINNRETFIAGLPHMSYYSPLDKPFLTEWLQSNIDLIKAVR